MERILVTGGAGFIGSHVVRALLDAGYEVDILDSLISGSRENVPPKARLIIGDIRDKDTLVKAMAGMDKVVHLAALVSVPESVLNPEVTLEVNVGGTENVFNAAQEAGVSRIVYASSAAVYGDEPTLPKREDTLLAPQSPYAQSKVKDERIAERSNGVSSMGLRFFNAYGPGQRADHAYASVIPRFIAFARKGKPLPLTGDGMQSRDFVHVRDIAAAVVMALSSGSTGVCNIASGEQTSINELIALIRTVVPIEVEHLPAREGDILHSVADISRAKEVLGWSPSTALADGVRELLV